ncbi:hypothetical protein DEO72_LG10g1755 [Vigna unguiculata]|uniref:Uncharacterized protein n=1 Tax=Vigna unguiculata TaxID=3917 RepID=A0A4D6NEB2_VIGUN|nr:hypothetical protein DEO72_LG10g1755 [Vigna unguiculata]
MPPLSHYNISNLPIPRRHDSSRDVVFLVSPLHPYLRATCATIFSDVFCTNAVGSSPLSHHSRNLRQPRNTATTRVSRRATTSAPASISYAIFDVDAAGKPPWLHHTSSPEQTVHALIRNSPHTTLSHAQRQTTMIITLTPENTSFRNSREPSRSGVSAATTSTIVTFAQPLMAVKP